MSNKELADKICEALFGTEYINRDSETAGCERLGYLEYGGLAVDGCEPVLLYVTDAGVEIHWMFNDAAGIDDISSYLEGAMRVIAPAMRWLDADERSIQFGYADDVDAQD